MTRSDPLERRSSTSTWAARMAVLASTAHALADDLAALARGDAAPDPATVAAARRVAATASELQVLVTSLSLPAAPTFDALADKAGALHQETDRLSRQIAALTVRREPPQPVDAVAATRVAEQAEELHELLSRRRITG